MQTLWVIFQFILWIFVFFPGKKLGVLAMFLAVSLNLTLSLVFLFPKGHFTSKKVSEYDQEIPHSHTADQPPAPLGRATEHLLQ